MVDVLMQVVKSFLQKATFGASLLKFFSFYFI